MIAVRSLFTELHSHGVCFLINMSLETDLMALFFVVGLVDANNVRPKNAFTLATESQKGIVEGFGDSHDITIIDDFDCIIWIIWISPAITNGYKLLILRTLRKRDLLSVNYDCLLGVVPGVRLYFMEFYETYHGCWICQRLVYERIYVPRRGTQ